MNNLTKEQKDYIIELYHIAKIPIGNNRYNRLLYVKEHFIKKYTEFIEKPKTIWLFICDITKVLR